MSKFKYKITNPISKRNIRKQAKNIIPMGLMTNEKWQKDRDKHVESITSTTDDDNMGRVGDSV